MDVTIRLTNEEIQDVMDYAQEHDLPKRVSLEAWIKGLILDRIAS